MQTQLDHKYSFLLDTSKIKVNLGKQSINAGVANILAQGACLFVSLGRSAILARILTPSDYGLFTMVLVIISFATLFKDLGLSTATIREKFITHQQVSNLFWINTLIGFSSTAIVFFISPLIAQFYGDDRLTSISVLLSISFLLGGLTVQHQALLKRQMQFNKLAVITTVALLISSIVGVILAYLNYGYWTLIWMNVFESLFILIGCWVCTGWVPCTPSTSAGTLKFLKIGLDVAGMNAFSTLTKHIDKIIIGRISTPALLGIYGKGNQIPNMISGQLRLSIFSIVLPALSTLQSEKGRFCNYYTNFLSVTCWATMSLSVFIFIFSHEIVLVLFGSKWLGSAIYMKIFSVQAFVMPAITTLDQIALALGHSRRYMIAGMVRSVCSIFGVSLGIFFGGTIGAAIGLVGANFLSFIPYFILCTKESTIGLKDFLQTVTPPAIITFMIGFTILYQYNNHSTNNLQILGGALTYFVLIFFGFIFCDYLQIGSYLRVVPFIKSKLHVSGKT